MTSGNRFTRGILAGAISTEEELRAAYRTEAKRAHPDLSEGDGHEDFLRLRAEYEHAFRALDRSGAGARPADGGAAGDAAFRDDPYAALEVLLKRDFPKTPRHRKEILRYVYARLRARSALGSLEGSLPSLFDSMEREALETNSERANAALVKLLASFLKAERTGSAPLRAATEMEVDRTFPPPALGGSASTDRRSEEGSDARPGPAAAEFLRALIGVRRG
jgi:hypothetical protein